MLDPHFTSSPQDPRSFRGQQREQPSEAHIGSTEEPIGISSASQRLELQATLDEKVNLDSEEQVGVEYSDVSVTEDSGVMSLESEELRREMETRRITENYGELRRSYHPL